MYLRKTVQDVRFWIVFFFFLRLIGITDPPLDGHKWRQTTVTMVARNFLEVDINILYPRIDIAGEKSGITGMEFPILNYLIYLASELFGYEHWYGRLINLIVSSFGLWFFYLLVRKYFTQQIAFYSTLILIVSIWFQFSAKIMPDTFSMSLVLAGVYFGTNYLDVNENKLKSLFLYFAFVTIGVLSKLPSGYLLSVFALLLLSQTIPPYRKFIFITTSILALIAPVIWYFYWVPHLVESFGFWHFFMGKSIEQGFAEIQEHLPLTMKRFYDTALKFTGFGMFLFGLVRSILDKNWKILSIMLVSFLFFGIVILKAGFSFPHHNYYIIPLVPVMALIAGYGLSKVKNAKLALLLLMAISIEGISNQIHEFRIKEKEGQILALEQDIDQVSNRTDLILINSNQDPSPMYFAHRKGWVANNKNISNKAFIDDLKEKGLKYIVIFKNHYEQEITLTDYRKILDNPVYCIYAL